MPRGWQDRKAVMEAVIFNIQRMSMHDGPGVRSTVFFKGCNLRCRWCHNPESICPLPEVEWNPQRCIGCGDCIFVCRTKARYLEGGRVVYDRERCDGCGLCAGVCVSEAVRVAGQRMEITDIVNEVEKDLRMYRITGGGVTCSGGEPMLQIEALEELLQELKRRQVHTAVDTAGNVPWSFFERILEAVDLFMFDIKHLDEEVHRKYTGVSNKRILENFDRLVSKKEVIVRVPVIKMVNEDSLQEIAAFLEGKGVRMVELLPYHELGMSKYEGLARERERFEAPSKEKMKEALACFRERGIPVKAAGEH